MPLRRKTGEGEGGRGWGLLGWTGDREEVRVRRDLKYHQWSWDCWSGDREMM
jgi:hypothetical protein